jgi:hypothetical protein
MSDFKVNVYKGNMMVYFVIQENGDTKIFNYRRKSKATLELASSSKVGNWKKLRKDLPKNIREVIGLDARMINQFAALATTDLDIKLMRIKQKDLKTKLGDKYRL